MINHDVIQIRGASTHNLQNVDVDIPRGQITVLTGVSGSGKSSLAFDTLVSEGQRRFFYTLSHYTRQFLDLATKPEVRSISGLSPTISLAQNETTPSRRATVGTLSDVTELLGVLFSRFGEAYCPDHDLPTTARSIEDMAKQISDQFSGQLLAIMAPIVESRKGNFAKRFQEFARKGYLQAWVDSELVSLSPTPKLDKSKKHTIKLYIDTVSVKSTVDKRLIRSLEGALEMGEGLAEVCLARKDRTLDMDSLALFSQKNGCSSCGFSWPALDPRYFSPGSLGKCPACDGYGYYQEDDTSENLGEFESVCDWCQGTGLDPKYNAIKWQGLQISDLHQAELTQLLESLKSASSLSDSRLNPACRRVVDELIDKVKNVVDIGLGYLQVSRRINLLRIKTSDNLTALLTSTWAHIDYIICTANDLFIMINKDERVSLLLQTL